MAEASNTDETVDAPPVEPVAPDATRSSEKHASADADADAVPAAADDAPRPSSAETAPLVSGAPAARAADAGRSDPDERKPSAARRASEQRVAAATLGVASVPTKTLGDTADARPLAAYELLARSARLGDLIALTDKVVSEGARTRAATWAFAPKVATLADEARLSRDDADTRFGNVLDVLGTGGEGTAERSLAAALWAHAVAESPRSRSEDEDRLAGDILWLATHTAFDATPLLDRALGDEAADLWTAIADRVRRIERGKGGALGRGEAVVGSAALAASGADSAARLSASLASEVNDPVLLRVLATGESTSRDEVRLEGQLVAAPRGAIATTILAFTGLLFAIHAVRFVARVALAYRRPAELSISEAGVRVKTRTEMLGRTLSEREHVILRPGLVRVVREVRFPSAAFYAGLLALALGSYVGARSLTDGVRAASPSLLLVGLVVVAAGVAADFVLGSLLPGGRGRCRIAFVPRAGATLCVGDVDIRRADEALARSLARR